MLTLLSRKIILGIICSFLFIIPSYAGRMRNDQSATGATGWTDNGTSVYLTTTSDNVGIGLTNPIGKLHIQSAGTTTGFALRIADSTPTDRLVVLDNGNVGIGTTLPSQKLQVVGTVAATTVTGANVTSGADPGHTHGSGSITEVDPNAILTDGTRSLSGDWDNGDFDISTLGNVGVGLTVPVYRLDIKGKGTGTGILMRIADSTPTDRLVVLDNGNVGIGTTAPIRLLDVSGTANMTTLSIGSTAVSSTATQLNYLNGATGTTGTTTTNLVFSTSPTFITPTLGAASATSLTTTGNVGIGTAVPVVRLAVMDGNVGIGTVSPIGSFQVGTSPATSLIVLANGNVGIGTASPVVLLQAGTSPNIGLMVIRTGNVGIGTTNPLQQLELTGDLKIGGDDLFMVTNTSGAVLVGDDTNYNPVVMSGDASIGTTGIVTVADDSHAHTGTTLSTIDISADTNLAGDTENVLTGDALSIGAAITRDTEWNSIDFLTGTATASLSGEIVAGTAPQGELGGTWASPTIDDLFLLNVGDIGSGTYDFTGNVSTLGNIGVGNTNPVYRLDIKGKGTGTGILMRIADSTPTDRLVVLDNGNVGIGTTAPSQLLEISGTSGLDGATPITLNLYSTNNGSWTIGAIYAQMLFGNADITGGAGEKAKISAIVERVTGGSEIGLAFGTTNNGNPSIERMRINSVGNVGIGTTVPLGLLQVGTSPNAPLVVLANGNVGIGTASPVVLLQAGTSPALGLMVLRTGNVGIGTTNPTTLLHVNGTANATTLTEGGVGVPNTNDNLSVFAATTSAQLAGVLSDETGTSLAVFNTSPVFVTGITDPLLIGGTAATSTLTLRSTSGTGTAGADIIFQAGSNGGTETMRILNNGNVGIGTASPGSTLQVGGGMTSAAYYGVGGTLRVASGNVNTNYQPLQVFSTDAMAANFGGGISFAGKHNTTGNEANDFEIFGGIKAAKNNGSPGDYGGNMWYWSRPYSGAGGAHIFVTGNDFDIDPTGVMATELMRITTGGSVGIGTTSPLVALSVIGRIAQSVWTADGDVVVNYDTGGTNAIGIATSDKRLKKDFEDIDLPLEKVLSIKGLLYHDKDQSDTDKKKLGIIAQDLLPICPELVFEYKNEENETYYGIHYERLAVLLLEAVKEQQKQIEELRKRLE